MVIPMTDSTGQKIKRAVLWRRLGVVRDMLEWYPDMSEDVKEWTLAERDKLLAALEDEDERRVLR
jgi:hypothetical protein